MSAAGPLVIDASVAVKWFLPEPDSAEADALRLWPQGLVAPDLLFAEVGNVLWKRVRRGEINAADADEMMATLCGLALTVRQTRSLARDAVALACSTGRTVYDCTYLALAVSEGGRLVTADEKLANALATTPLAAHVSVLSAVTSEQTGNA